MSPLSGMAYLLDVRTVLVFGAALLASYYLVRRRDTRKLPPGPPILPILGSLPIFALEARHYRSPFALMKYWQKKYGNVLRMRFGPREAVIISGYKMFTEALRKHKRVFDSRPVLRGFQAISRDHGVVSTNGPMWYATRKFVSGALREMGVGKKSLEQHIHEEAGYLIDALDTGTTPLYPRSILMKGTANVVLRICFGERLEYDDAEFIEMIRNLNILLQTVGIRVLENFWPWIEYFPPLAQLPTLRAADKVVMDFAQRRLTEHKTTFDAADTRDLSDLHLKQRESWDDERLKSDFHMCRTVMELFIAGTDTSAANMSWLILHLIRYPEIQAKCQQEIDKFVGSGRMVSLSDKSNLVYNMAVLNEVQRHRTFAPLGVPRGVIEDIELDGYLVRKGTMAMFHLDSVHRDKSYWGADADEFRPERWIDENGQLRTFDGFVPFCYGTRQCIGEPLALMEAFLFFTNVIQRLTFKLPEGAPLPEMEGVQSGVVQIPEKYHFVTERR